MNYLIHLLQTKNKEIFRIELKCGPFSNRQELSNNEWALMVFQVAIISILWDNTEPFAAPFLYKNVYFFDWGWIVWNFLKIAASNILKKLF